jgi:hypothetical protein
MSKRAQKDAERDYARHKEENYPVRYPFYASNKPWPEHRLTETESKEHYESERASEAYHLRFRELFWEDIRLSVRLRESGFVLERGRFSIVSNQGKDVHGYE